MKVLVTGDRNWIDSIYICDTLDKYGDITVVIEGDARGADRIAGAWAQTKGIPNIKIPAQWDYYGTRAGSLRNRWMLDLLNPELVVAFHPDITQSKGTKAMVEYAKSKNTPVDLFDGT
jgi:hypothetical protein